MVSKTLRKILLNLSRHQTLVLTHDQFSFFVIDNKQMPQFDFAKIDIQGGELAVLKGGKNYIQANVVGLEIEVEFAEIYTYVDTNNGTTAVLTRSDTGLSNPVYFGGFKNPNIFNNSRHAKESMGTVMVTNFIYCFSVIIFWRHKKVNRRR